MKFILNTPKPLGWDLIGQLPERYHLSYFRAGLDTEEITCGILESARYHFAAKP
jgi:hypothetical protein